MINTTKGKASNYLEALSYPGAMNIDKETPTKIKNLL